MAPYAKEQATAFRRLALGIGPAPGIIMSPWTRHPPNLGHGISVLLTSQDCEIELKLVEILWVKTLGRL